MSASGIPGWEPPRLEDGFPRVAIEQHTSKGVFELVREEFCSAPSLTWQSIASEFSALVVAGAHVRLTVEPPATQSGRQRQLLVCPHCVRPYTSRGGLDAHLRAKHPDHAPTRR